MKKKWNSIFVITRSTERFKSDVAKFKCESELQTHIKTMIDSVGGDDVEYRVYVNEHYTKHGAIKEHLRFIQQNIEVD